jgi:hypothetical protein
MKKKKGELLRQKIRYDATRASKMPRAREHVSPLSPQ